MSTRFKIVGKDFFDMFEDEAVTYVKKVQDFSQIDTSYGDFSFSFNIPATVKNLNLFDFYDRPDYVNALNPFQTIDGEMWVNSQFFASGSIRLIDYAYENLEPVQIQIQFLSEGTNLKNALTSATGEILKLAEINNNWKGYEHTTSRTNMLSYISGGAVGSTGLKYPLISQTYAWQWSSPPMDNTRNISISNDGILTTELRPAILVSDVVDAIFAQAGYNYEILFDAEFYYSNLWMWIANGKTFEANDLSYKVAGSTVKSYDLDTATPQQIFFGNITQDQLNLYNQATGEIRVSRAGSYQLGMAFNTADYLTIDWRYKVNGVSSAWITPISATMNYTSVAGLAVDDVITIEYRYNGVGFTVGGDEFKARIDFDNGLFVPDTDMNISTFMPDITCTDFLLGILRAFNAIMYWDAYNDMFVIDHRTEWLNSGNEYDISDMLDTSRSTLSPPPFYKTFALKWQEPKDYLNVTFSENNEKSQYGAAYFGLDYKLGEDYEQVSPFTNSLWQEVVSVDTNNNIIFNSYLPSFQSVNPKEQNPGVRLMYFNGTKSLNGTLTVADSSGKDLTGTSTVNDFQNVYVAQDFMLSYNAEYDYNLGTLNLVTDNLYTKFYSGYVSFVYSPTTRRYKLTAYLDLPTLLDLKLNDTLKIQDKKFMINSMSVNLLTGKVDFELIDKYTFETI